jgi:hypothetical protein
MIIAAKSSLKILSLPGKRYFAKAKPAIEFTNSDIKVTARDTIVLFIKYLNRLRRVKRLI